MRTTHSDSRASGPASWAGEMADVRYYRAGAQPSCHPIVGDLDLDFDAIEFPPTPD